MTEKRKLPNRRVGYNQKFKVGGQTLFLRTGEYPDGSLGEIFVDLSKTEPVLSALLNGFCISISVGLQHGVPLDWLVDKFTFFKFEPAGTVEYHKDIKRATSILDAIFRDLGINYLGRQDLKHSQENSQNDD